MTIAFDDNIPKSGPEVFIKRLEGNENVTFTCFSEKIRGIWVHWNDNGNRSEPHYETGCICETRPIPKRWKGFLHGYISEKKQEVFLELTPVSAESLMAQIDGDDQLRGAYFRVKRSAAKNGRVTVQILGRVDKLDTLPKEKDARKSILKLWGVPEGGKQVPKSDTDGPDKPIPFGGAE